MLLSYPDARRYFLEEYGITYSEVTLRRLVMEGRLPRVKLFNGRTFIKSEDIDAIIQNSYVPASTGPLASEPMGVHRG